jgi:hypothetical protein
MDKVLEFPGLPNGIGCIFEPFLVSFVGLFHFLRGYFHSFLDELLVGNFTVVTHEKIHNSFIFFSMILLQDIIFRLVLEDPILLLKVPILEIGGGFKNFF